MVFQATRWGWKRLAARLLLVPVLAGGAAAGARAQMPQTAGSPGTPPAKARPVMAATGDPKVMLKEGRKALEQGRFNDAQDLARRAEASNRSGKWGLFDDTPAALLKDVQAAVAKAQKIEAEQLVKKAKALLTKHATSETERAADLKAALGMAHRAESLHGPYSVWDIGDRADKLAKEIEAARAKLRTLPPPPNGMAKAPGTGQPPAGPRPATTAPTGPGGVVAAGGPQAPGRVTPTTVTNPAGGPAPLPGGLVPTAPAVAGVMPPAPAAGGTDPRKTATLKLMTEAKQAANRGDFVAARAKLDEAAKLGAAFGPAETSPGLALQELNAQGAAAVNQALKEAHAQTDRKEYAKAEAALTAAAEIATALKLFTPPIEQAKSALRTASNGQYGRGPLVAGLSPAGGPEKLVPLGPAPATMPGIMSIADPVAPIAPPGVAAPASLAKSAGPVPPAAPPGVAPARLAKSTGPVPPIAPPGITGVAATIAPVPVALPTNPVGLGPIASATPIAPPGLAPIPAANPATLPANPGIVSSVTPVTLPDISSGAGPIVPAAPASPVAPSSVASGAVPAPTVPGSARVGGPVKPLPGEALTGRQLLDQAVVEYSRGDFELARRLALQAHNLGEQIEARGLLNQIDAESLAAKQRAAAKSFEAAAVAARNNEHEHALRILVLIDPRMLPSDLRAKKEELVAACQAQLDKTGGPKPDAALVAVGGMQPPGPGGDLQSVPGSARVGSGLPTDPRPAGPDSLTTQADAMRKVTLQKLRGEGLKVQADAQSAFGRGETDVAIQMLLDYSARVRAAGLDPGSVALLLRPVESRVEMFRVMKGNTDAVARLNKERKDAKEQITGRGAADEQRKAEVQRLARQYHDLVRESKFAEAERVAMQAKQLEPDDPAIGNMAYMATMQRRIREAEKLKSDKEKFVYGGLNAAEVEGPLLDTQDPVAVAVERSRLAHRRGRGDDTYLKTMTPKEFEIQTKLDNPISIEFNETPLSQVIENLRTLTGLPFSYDTASLEAEAISTARPITEKLPGVSARNALHLILDKAGLNFVIEYDTVRITTNKKAKGRLVTKVFSVADLVTPIPNFALPEYANFEKMMGKNAQNSPNAMIQGLNTGVNAPVPTIPHNGLNGGAMAGSMPGVAGAMNFGGGGSLQPSPLGPSGTLAPDRNTKHEQLIKLVTGMVRPYSWDAMGGPGRVEYFDLGSALVVNQTADVIREIQDLLEALRRLQDLAVAVEIRIISLSESFFERMGVDFSMNISTHNTNFEPNLTSGSLRPEPFINSLQGYKGITAGLTAAGAGTNGSTPVFTPDLAVPIASTSFAQAIPPFGGYPNSPGADGGVSLGLAFLNDIQVYLFMEAAQGDRRVNVMQAPKLTLFNGQTSTVGINELQFFVTSVQVFSVNGQIVFVPNNTALPGPGSPTQGGGAINIGLQAVVSADRRFVRINIPVTLAAQSGTTVPLFPVTTFITPVFEGGSQGVPIPFTQFLQQPGFVVLNIQTTVVCPDGGTVLLGGFKKLSEGRNEFGPPFLSKIPYLNRLFKNVGIGRDTSHVMIMITPRIIINSEEEINQTEGGPVGSGGPAR